MISISLSKYTTPEVKEDKMGEWVNYGDDNNYFMYLIERYLKSTTNNAILNGKIAMVYGKGLDASDSNRKPEAYALMRQIFKDKDVSRVVSDFEILNMGAFQIVYKNGRVSNAYHFPMETLRPEKCNKDGEIEAWYYHPNWAEKKSNEEPERISAFGFGNGKSPEILVIQPYCPGHYYFSPVSYQGALPYAVLEEEIADYLINDTINGFSGTKVVNFHNGIPDEKKRQELVMEIERKLTGARGKKVIVSFNDGKETAPEVTDIPLNDAPEHYQYLSDECFRKLLVGHRVTSPMLLGVRDGNSGLGNNADEIKNATLLYDNLVIKDRQRIILDAINEVLEVNGVSLNTYFKTLQPLEFTETDGLDRETAEQETGVKMCSHVYLSAEEADTDNKIAQALIDLGEDESDEWELIHEEEVDYDLEEQKDAFIDKLNGKKQTALSKLINLVSTGTARPNAKSEQDQEKNGVKYKVRYQYSPLRVSANSREFCKKMVAANKIYRKEDIIAMGERVVNAGWGPKGADKYSIWLYKGGGSCHHKWLRKTYRSTVNVDVNNPNARTISTAQARREGVNPVNEKEVSMAPKDMPYDGFLPSNKRFR